MPSVAPPVEVAVSRRWASDWRRAKAGPAGDLFGSYAVPLPAGVTCKPGLPRMAAARRAGHTHPGQSGWRRPRRVL